MAVPTANRPLTRQPPVVSLPASGAGRGTAQAIAYLILLLAALLRLYQLRFGQWRNDEEIIWLHALRAVAARQFPWVGIPSDLGIANGPGQMLPVLPAVVLGTPYVAYVLVASLNVLAVAALYSLGRLWGGDALGLASALIYATSPWAVIYSRRLWGNDMLAPFVVLFVTALWLFVARQYRWRIVIAAVWLALLLQMYIAAIVQLTVLAVGLLLAAARYGRRGRRPALPILAALLVFLGLTAGYGIQAFPGHVADLTRAVRDTRSETPQPVGLPNWGGFGFLIQSVQSGGYQFYAQHVSTGPLFLQGPVAAGNALALLLFGAGIAFLCWRILQVVSGLGRGRPRDVAAPLLLLTWLLAMPVALLAHNAPVCACYLLPSYPAQYLVMGLGAIAVGSALTRLMARSPVAGRHTAAAPVASGQGDLGAAQAPFTMPAALAGHWLTGLLLGGLLLTQSSVALPLFGGIGQYWPSDQYGLPYAWHGRIIDAVASIWRPGLAIVVSGHGELDGVLRDEIDTRLPAGHARIVDDQRWLALPGRGQQPMVVLLTSGSSVAHNALRRLVREHPESLRATVTIPGAGEQFDVLQITDADREALTNLLAPTQNRHAANIQFASDVSLDRYALPVRLPPGQQVSVALEWTILRTQPFIPAYSFYVHLADAKGTTAMVDAPFLPPNLWQKGEQVWTFGALSDAGQPTGVRDVLIGLYKLKGTQARDGVISIPETVAGGRTVAEFRQGPFVVHAANVSGSGVTALQARFAPGLSLVRAQVPATATAGSTLSVTLYWLATELSPPRYTVFLHLVDQAGVLRAQQDVEPQAGSFPTSTWLLNELVTDTHVLPSRRLQRPVPTISSSASTRSASPERRCR